MTRILITYSSQTHFFFLGNHQIFIHLAIDKFSIKISNRKEKWEEKKVKFHHRCMSYCERCWHTQAYKKQSCPYDNIVKWNSIYTKKIAKKKSEKINNFYVRQKHACLEARWMCQKKLWMPSRTHTASLRLRGKIFFSLFSIIIYFYALSRKQSKKFFLIVDEISMMLGLEERRDEKIHLWNDGTQHQRERVNKFM